MLYIRRTGVTVTRTRRRLYFFVFVLFYTLIPGAVRVGAVAGGGAYDCSVRVVSSIAFVI